MREAVDRERDEHTTEVLELATSEEFLVLERATGRFHSDSLLNLVVQEGDSRVIQSDTLSLQTGNDSAGFLVFALLSEPTGGLWQEQQKWKHDHGEEALERNREAPLGRAVNVGEAVIDPVGHDDTDQGDGAVDGDDFTTVLGTGSLRLVSRDGGGQCANTLRA